MTLAEVCERVGDPRVGFIRAFVEEGMAELARLGYFEQGVLVQDIANEQRYYRMPSDYISIVDIAVLNHGNDDDEYRSIPRLLGLPEHKDPNDD